MATVDLTPPERASLRTLLIEAATHFPDRTLAIFEDGTRWSRADALEEAKRAANILADHGVRQGDYVVLIQDNDADWWRAWWGAALLGAVIAPLNPAFKGQMLQDVFTLVKPRLIIVAAEYRQRIEDASWPVLESSMLGAEGVITTLPDVTVKHTDIHAIFFTSGTTGPSKGSLCTNVYFWEMAKWREQIPVDETDLSLGDLPLYHTGAANMLVYMLVKGGGIVVRRKPTLSNYWRIVKQFGITTSLLVGSMVEFLLAQPETADDCNHTLRSVNLAPLPRNIEAFKTRFGIDKIVTSFGATEMGSVLANPPSLPLRPPSSGVARAGVALRLVDEDGNDVLPGIPGELLVKPANPLTMSQGYVNNPEATAAVWIDGWYHSGDRMYCDKDGYYYFHDRKKDSLRRRGENISSFEVEREMLAYEPISEAACIGVHDNLGSDEEIKVFLLPKDGCIIDLEDLTRFLANRMPYYMVPRFFEIVAQFSKTPTGRVRKFELREMQDPTKTWDREAHGFFVDRNGLRVAERTDGSRK